MKLDRVEADAEFDSRRGVVVAFDEELQQAFLVRGEIVLGALRRAYVAEESDDAVSYFGRHRRAARDGFANVFQNFRGRGALQQITARTGAERVENSLVIVINRQH